MHCILQLENHGNFKLELNRIRAAAKAALGYSIHLSAPVTGDTAKAYAAYASKKAGQQIVDL